MGEEGQELKGGRRAPERGAQEVCQEAMDWQHNRTLGCEGTKGPASPGSAVAQKGHSVKKQSLFFSRGSWT